MEDELKKSIKDWIDYQNERQAELEKKYPPNPPNDVCKDALVSGIFAPAVWIGKCVPGKIGGMCKKAFGSSYYDLEMSQYKHNYVIRKFEESIKLTEEKEL